MVSNDKRIRIITGHYGSGKTEFAVNYVTALREQTEGHCRFGYRKCLFPLPRKEGRTGREGDHGDRF